MKRIIYLMIILLMLFLISCESPLKIKLHQLDDVVKSLFFRDDLTNGNDFSIGYENGNIQTSKIALTWEVSNVENFAFYKLLKNDQLLATYTDSYITSYTDSMVIADNLYQYELAVFAENLMNASDTISIKTPRWDAPSDLDFSAYNISNILIAWQDNSESEENFIIQIHDVSPMGTYQDSFVVDADVTEFLFAVPDTTDMPIYSIKIKAVNQWEEDTSYSPTLNIYMSLLEFEAPTDLVVGQLLDNIIQLDWEDNSNMEIGFCVERKINSDDFIEIAQIDTVNFTTYFDLDSLAYEVGDTLIYRVRAYNDYDDLIYTDYSNEAMIIISAFNGINENFNDGIANNWIDDWTGRWDIVNNRYRMEGNGSEDALAYYNEIMTDFTYEADVYKVNGDYATALYFRGDGVVQNGDFQNGYIFDICDEEYTIGMNINGNFYPFTGWVSSNYFHPMDEGNNLKVVCEGANLSFYINDNWVDTIWDDTFSEGFVGFWAYDNGNDIVDFDNALLTYDTNTLEEGRKIIPQRADKKLMCNSEVTK